MSDFLIRTAEIRDLVSIVEMALELKKVEESFGCDIFSNDQDFITATTEEMIDALGRDDRILLVAVVDDVVVGVLYATVHGCKKIYRYNTIVTAETTFIKPVFRDERLSSELHKVFRDIAKSKGAEAIRCVCFRENKFPQKKLLDFGMQLLNMEFFLEL